MPSSPSAPIAARRLLDIDWPAWTPVDRATLLFVVRGDEVLLIRKKRGLGAGKINGPGGRIEDGETPVEGARREIAEELCVEVDAATHHGELLFQFIDGYSIHVEVFRADDRDGENCRGEAVETAEAIPLWTPVDAIPYDEMWADDRLWLPILLAGGSFHGRFLFDGDAMLDHEVVVA